jgi:1-acyl-sn-glycerol-3-phosphate acyltransferase
MLEKRFFSLKIKNRENYDKRDTRFANILYAPHNNWWDGIVGYNLCRRVFKTDIRMMIEEMNRFPILARAGAFPVNKKSAQASMRALQYSVDELCDNKKSLWIFPQGIIRPPMYRPIEFQTGLAYIAKNVVKKAGGINLIPVAVNYPFLREDKPEVLCEVGEPIVLTAADFDRKDFTQKLEKEFESLCDKQFLDITKGNIDGYEYLYKQKLKWYKKLEKRLKRIEINTNSGV